MPKVVLVWCGMIKVRSLVLQRKLETQDLGQSVEYAGLGPERKARIPDRNEASELRIVALVDSKQRAE